MLATALVLMATLSSCAGSSESAAGPASATPASSPSTSVPGEPTPTTRATTLSHAGGEATAGSLPRCRTKDLDVSLAKAVAPPDTQPQAHVVVTNRSTTRCAVSGYLDVDLRSATGVSYGLVRSPLTTITTITLLPGGQAHATLSYAPATADSPMVFTPTSLVVGPPDQPDSTAVPWPFGPIMDQSGATHPATYVQALAPGA